MTKDLFKANRRKLRPGWSFERIGKGDKTINRRIVRKRLKRNVQIEMGE